MIVYTMVSNSGGMLRVAESAFAIHAQLKDLVDIKIFIFSQRPIEGESHPDIQWIDWNESENPYSQKQIEYYRQIIKEKISSPIDFIIGDYMTLAYFDFPEARIIYDVHVLGKPLYNAIKSSRGIHALDKLTTAPMTTLVDAQEFLFLKFENRFISRASRFITNSQNSGRYLRDLYTSEVEAKPITYIPVASELKTTDQTFDKTMDVYFFGRFHPVKGLHLMFEQDWREHPLFIRGIDPRALTKESQELLLAHSISVMPWAWDSLSLVEELLRSRLVIFPAIYEPWGLALQEALSLGCICLANKNNSGHEEQIEDGVNGFLVDMHSADWFKRVSEILNLPKERLNQISKMARERATLGHASRTEGFVEYIKDLLGQKA